MIKRTWGFYEVLSEWEKSKVKVLTVEPGQNISNQKHNYRNEFWFIVSGHGAIVYQNQDIYELKQHDIFTVRKKAWHQLVNTGDEPLVVVEIQFGDKCEEEDIVRDTFENIMQAVAEKNNTKV